MRVFLIYLVSVVLGTIHNMVFADQLITRHDLVAPKFRSVSFSNDGNSLHFLTLLYGVDNLAEYDLITHKQRFLTRFGQTGIKGYLSSYDSRYLLYWKDNSRKGRGDIYCYDRNTGRHRSLTHTLERNIFILSLSRKHPHEILIVSNARNSYYYDVYRVNIVTGQLEMICRNNYFKDFVADDELNLVVAYRYRANGDKEIYLYRNENWHLYEVVPAADKDIIFNIVAGKALRISSKGADKTALYQVDLYKHRQNLIFKSAESDIETVLVNPENREPIVVTTNFTKTKYPGLDQKTKTRLVKLKTLGFEDFGIVDVSLKNDRWLVLFQDERDYGTVFLCEDKPKFKVVELFKLAPKLADKKLPSLKPYLIRSRDGLTLVSYLTLPTDFKQPGPMVLLVHGGPCERDKFEYNLIHKLLANRGYAVLSVNYRGSSGFGKKFFNAGNREWGRKMQDDLTDAVRWAIRQKIADPKKIAIMGASYGGYAALCGLTFTPNLFCCGISLNGVSDMNYFLQHLPDSWYTIKAMIERQYGDISNLTEQKRLAQISPINYVEKINAPLLLLQSANDDRVHKEETDTLVNQLMRAGKNFEYIVFNELGHQLSSYEMLGALVFVEQFLARHLGGKCEAVGDDLKGIKFTRVK